MAFEDSPLQDSPSHIYMALPTLPMSIHARFLHRLLTTLHLRTL